jgi:uncharacterized protein (DUF58 family)
MRPSSPGPTPGPRGPTPSGSSPVAGKAPRPGGTRRRRRAYDRVGGARLTGAGTILFSLLLLGLAAAPRAGDRQVVALVWAVFLGILVVGAVAPRVLVRWVRVTAESPRDATVGDEVAIGVTLAGRASVCEVRALDPTGAWQRASVPVRGSVRHLADRRGLFGSIRIEVRVTAPLGVLAAHRVHQIDLPHAVEVAPRAIDVDWVPQAATSEGSAVTGRVASLTGDLVRSVRPYVSGDPAHLVHWPSSARLGTLVVRELEPPSPARQAVLVDLRGLGADTERAASFAMGAAAAVLAGGGELVLCTSEAGGPVTGRVGTVLDAGRRLARAVPGPPGAPPSGWPLVEIGA